MKDLLEIEIWKDIPGYEGKYQASSFGRIKSLERMVTNGRLFSLKNEMILKPLLQYSGYEKITLWNENVRKIYFVHQLIAIVFLNHTPNKYLIVVDHINNIKNDNRLVNLQLLTHRLNVNKEKEKINKFTGTYFDKYHNKYRSEIMIKFKSVFLGYFNNQLEAHNFYISALSNINLYDGNAKFFRQQIKLIQNV